MKYHYLVIVVFFLALNWNLFSTEDVSESEGESTTTNKPLTTKTTKAPKYGNFSDEFKAKFANMSVTSKEFTNKLAKFGSQMNTFNMCMGVDFLKKCKYYIAMCAIAPSPPLCLIGIAGTCGGINAKKCYNQAYGNGTTTTTGTAEILTDPTTPPPDGRNAAMADA